MNNLTKKQILVNAWGKGVTDYDTLQKLTRFTRGSLYSAITRYVNNQSEGLGFEGQLLEI